MKYLLILATGLFILSCQKNTDLDPPASHHSILDSMGGQWVYEYDYRLISTQADPTVIIDSVFSGNYAPLSYFKVNADSSYRWWRTEMEVEPAAGHGQSGKITVINDTLRYIRMSHVTSTSDNFVTEETIVPITTAQYKIKMLTNNKMVLTFTVPTSDGKLWHWHDVYIR